MHASDVFTPISENYEAPYEKQISCKPSRYSQKFNFGNPSNLIYEISD